MAIEVDAHLIPADSGLVLVNGGRGHQPILGSPQAVRVRPGAEPLVPENAGGSGILAGDVSGFGPLAHINVQNATVFATRTETGETIEIPAPGGHFAARLPAGTYEVTVEADGFSPAESETISVGRTDVVLRMKREE